MGPAGSGNNWFEATRWDLVFTARDATDERGSEALQELCRSYWQPLYKFIRARNYGEFDAQDLTQEFFHHLFRQDFLAHLKHSNGKFRTFLLTFLTRFLSDQRDRAKAQKRGGHIQFIAVDEFDREEQFQPAYGSTISPEEAFDRRWALAVSENAARRLQNAYLKRGKSHLFDVLNQISKGSLSTQEGAAHLKISVAALKTAQTRMKQDYQRHLRAEVADCSHPEELEAEFRYLIQVLGKNESAFP